jgi:hypothetical protein
MTRKQPKSQPTWTDVKAKLASLDRPGLMRLIQDFYKLQEANRTFLHTRFNLGEDVLMPYKEILERWLCPDIVRNQDPSVTKAKQAISEYRKAVGEAAGLAELMVFYCECSADFSNEFGYQDEGYFNALCRMFEQALKVIETLPPSDRNDMIGRLEHVRSMSRDLGCGVAEEMGFLLSKNRLG